MWSLGFDSTSAVVSAALLDDDRVSAVYTADSAVSHSTTLLPVIERLLVSAGIGVPQLDLIAFSAGPGSFTGVRIGTACAKGLAMAYDTPCIGVSSLEAMAYMFADIPSYICPALDARHGNVFGALFASDGKGNITRLCEDSLRDVNETVDAVSAKTESGTPLYIPGDACEALGEAFEKRGVTPARAPLLLRSPCGAGVALAGLNMKKRFPNSPELFDAALAKPIYLRKSQAEREREEKENIKNTAV